LEKVDILNGHLEYLTDILDILLTFSTFCVSWVHFSAFGIMHKEKSGTLVEKS
jgi:D-alanyl-lipoteichoic acid acyltransferase DltB (MBOAT superfamily)